jgi:hypothetical protein
VFLRVHGVAVPKALRARRVNRLRSLGVRVEPEQLAQLTQLLDADGDGAIDYAEFVGWFRGGGVAPERGGGGPHSSSSGAAAPSHAERVAAL